MGSGEARELLARGRVSLAYRLIARSLFTDKSLAPVRKNGNDEKLLKISYIVSRRTSIDVFTGKSSDIGPFAKDLIVKLAEGSVKEALSNLTGTLLSKLLGAASGSAQTERI